jgi:phosphatidylglycerol---prolipoprotein diacylglyceryl transferase
MHPVLFEFNLYGRDVALKSYTCFLVLAAIAAVSLGAEIARRRGLDIRKSAFCLLLGIIATAIGARLIHWLTNPASFDGGLRSVFSLDRSNLSAFAGLLFGVPISAIAARRLGISAWRLADASAPALGLAVAIARVGCFLNGCCFGVSTHVPWGVSVSAGSDAHLAQIVSGSIGLFDAPIKVHPTQLYEAAAALLGCFLALWLLRRSRIDGEAFLAFALWFTCFRWANSSFLYVPPSFTAPHWLYPAFYALVIIVCVTKLLMLRSRKCREGFSGPLHEGILTHLRPGTG